jgi:hypothetical protein
MLFNKLFLMKITQRKMCAIKRKENSSECGNLSLPFECFGLDPESVDELF